MIFPSRWAGTARVVDRMSQLPVTPPAARLPLRQVDEERWRCASSMPMHSTTSAASTTSDTVPTQ